MLEDWLKIGGIGFIIMLVILLAFIPIIATIIIGIWIANQLGLTGLVWWSFIILFWIIITSLIAKLSTNP